MNKGGDRALGTARLSGLEPRQKNKGGFWLVPSLVPKPSNHVQNRVPALLLDVQPFFPFKRKVNPFVSS